MYSRGRMTSGRGSRRRGNSLTFGVSRDRLMVAHLLKPPDAILRDWCQWVFCFCAVWRSEVVVVFDQLNPPPAPPARSGIFSVNS